MVENRLSDLIIVHCCCLLGLTRVHRGQALLYDAWVEQIEANRRRKSVLIPAVLTVVVWPPIGVFGVMAAMMSPMLYASSGSQDNPYIAIMIAAVVSLPFLCFISVIVSLYFAFKEWTSRANRLKVWLWAGLPLLSLAILLLGVVLMEVFCDGQLDCGGT